ncbi:MAG: hypothetical protein LBH53_01985, partial [Puniceicoccales bacterium]|nr:hypothetical protein [Puniceicoccales bacterium]
MDIRLPVGGVRFGPGAIIPVVAHNGPVPVPLSQLQTPATRTDRTGDNPLADRSRTSGELRQRHSVEIDAKVAIALGSAVATSGADPAAVGSGQESARTRFRGALAKLKKQTGNLPPDCQKRIAGDLAMRFADGKNFGKKNAVGYFKGLELHKKDDSGTVIVKELGEVLDAMVGHLRRNASAEDLSGQLQDTQMRCTMYSIWEQLEGVMGAAARAQDPGQVTKIRYAMEEILGAGFIANVRTFSSEVRATPMFEEYNMADVDEKITEEILKAYYPDGKPEVINPDDPNDPGNAYVKFEEGIRDQFTALRKAEGKVGPRGRGNRDVTHVDLQRKDASALRFAAQDAYIEGSDEQGTEESRATIEAGLPQGALAKFAAVSEEYGIPPGAAYFEMMSKSRLELFNHPARFVAKACVEKGIDVPPYTGAVGLGSALQTAILAVAVPPSGGTVGTRLAQGEPPNLTSMPTFSKVIDDA